MTQSPWSPRRSNYLATTQKMNGLSDPGRSHEKEQSTSGHFSLIHHWHQFVQVLPLGQSTLASLQGPLHPNRNPCILTTRLTPYKGFRENWGKSETLVVAWTWPKQFQGLAPSSVSHWCRNSQDVSWCWGFWGDLAPLCLLPQ